MNAIDPDGKDIIVLMDPKSVIGFGHAAVLIGNEKDGWTYYSKDGANNSSRMSGAPYPQEETNFATIEDFNKATVTKDYHGYSERTRYSTSAEQDDKAKKAMSTAVNSYYNLFTSNCVQAVSKALEAAGLNPGYDLSVIYYVTPHYDIVNDYSIIPRRLYYQMMNYNSDKIVPMEENGGDQPPRSSWADFKNQLGLWLSANPTILLKF